MKIGDTGVCQGAEERSSLLSKLLFARYCTVLYSYILCCNAKCTVLMSVLYYTVLFTRYRGKKRGSIKDGQKIKTPFNFFSLPSSRASSPLPLRRNKFVR